jgi:ribosomal-protein-serine acetyltransferase
MFRLTIQDGIDLTLMEERHADVIFDAVERDRAYLREWLPWVDQSTSVDDISKFIRTSLDQFANNEGMATGIWCEGEFAGTIGTHKIDWLNRKVEIGYWLASKFQGRGIITAGCRAFMHHAFSEWKLNRVEIHCASGNTKSCAIAKRLGYRFEGMLREAQLLNGNYVDTNVYSMLASEWQESLDRQHIESAL